FLYYVLGSISTTTIAVGSTIPESFYYVTVENENMSLHGAKVDTWELTVEEGSPVRAEFTAIGKNIGTTGASPFTPDFNNPPKMQSDVSVTVGGSTIEYNRLSLRISNGIEPIYKGSLNPQELRETGLEVTGRIRAPKYSQFISEGAMVITISNVGQISMPNVRLTEVPPRVSGFDLPETEISFRAYPTTTEDAIKVTLTNTLKW
ncbi:MAG: phage tail tube protein, partial [Ignisphaera sp.]